MVGAICGTAVAFDGYDVVVYGATLSSLREEWHLSPQIAGYIGSAALVGMLCGALLVGPVSHRAGRRRTFLGAVAWFSVFMAACAAAPGPAIFAALRFLGGLGLGAMLPLAAAMTVESASPQRENLAYVAMQTGFPAGGVLAAVAGMALLEQHSWHWMYLIAAIPLITVVPAALRWLPESREEPSPASQHQSSADPAKTPEAHPEHAGVRLLFRPGYARATVLLWGMSFCSLLFVYGANTWLPSLMHDDGASIAKSFGFLLSFNGGAIAGGFLAGWAADRWESRPVVLASFLLGAAGVVAFSAGSSAGVMLVLAAITGYGAVATQTLVNGWSTRYYPPEARTTGIGFSLGVGRVGGIAGPSITGLIVAATGGGAAAFSLFAGVAVVGAVLAWLVPRSPVARDAAAVPA